MSRAWRLLWVFVFISFSAFADTNQVFPRPANFLSSDALKRMSEKDVEKTIRDLVATVQQVMAKLKNKDYLESDASRIMLLSRYQATESMEALISILRGEMKRFSNPTGGARIAVMMTALDAMGAIGTKSPHRYVEELEDLAQELEARSARTEPKYHAVLGAVMQKMQVVQTVMMSRLDILVSLEVLAHNFDQAKHAPNMTLERAQKMLDERLIGQPEVVQALMDMEWRNQLYGKARTVPDAIYLMGLPGTGKDTAAEVFADALNGAKGAHHRHLFRLPLLKSKADLWQLLGSATGYIGSEAFPPFLQFLVLHSNGKYKTEEVEQNGRKSTKIVLNPEYKGETLPGYFSPNRGIVFVNEFHNWSKQLKDDFIKQALEKGIFAVNNPNGGEAEITVPIRFVIASNEGIGLTTSREANGQRHGKAFTYEQMLKKWEGIHENKSALKGEILASNGSKNSAVAGESTPGISEELLNRIPERFILLMRPLSPDHLRTIAVGYLNNLKQTLADSPLLGQVNLTWSDDLPQILQEYSYMPEENARPVLGRVMSLIEEPLLDAIRAKKVESDSSPLDIHIRIESNPNRSRDLVIVANGQEIRQLIRTTKKDIPGEPISDQRIADMAGLEPYMKANVFGIDEVLERLSERMLSIENEATAGASKRPVNVLMLNGLSSTGKTETAKQLAKYIHKADDELVTFDFSQVQTLHDFKVRILGLKDGLGNPVPSEFMKHYDRANGRLVVAFDELANVRDMELLKALYDFFREPVVSTFSDGKPRPMGGVTVIITGNPGQELFAGVPRNVPMEVQMLAWEEIARKTSNDPELQRSVLEKTYPEPFITRIGRNNIFFLPPHSYKSLRQLAQLKLGQTITRLASEESRRGWKLAFPSTDEYAKFIDMIIDEGFSLRYQGASIDSFVRDDVEEKLKALMLKNLVPSGATAVLKFREKTSNELDDKPGYVFYDVHVAGMAPMELKIRRPHVDKPLAKDQANDLLTAFHEAGHSLVRHALFPGVYKSTMVSIIPGVGLIGDQYLYYLGVAKSMQQKEAFANRDFFVRQIAILLAGETAERLVSQGNSSAGKSNDIERATKIARDVILRFGLSSEWGLRAPATGNIADLPEEQRKLLDREVQTLLAEGRVLAEQTIEANFNETFIPLALGLAEKGMMQEEDLDAFYTQRRLTDPTKLSVTRRTMNHARTLARKWRNFGKGDGELQIDASIPMPKAFADLEAMALKRKQDQYAQVPLPTDVPISPLTEVPKTSQEKAPDKRLGVEAPLSARACEHDLKP